MAKVLVTGGAGFIASHIADAFIGAGDEVHVLDDLSSGLQKNIPAQARFKEYDIRGDGARSYLRQLDPDVIVHAAAQISVRTSMSNPRYDVEVNVAGIVNMLQAFAGKRLPYIVFLSTGGAIYGEQEKFPAPEDHPIRPTSVYGLSKRVSEMYLDFWGREYGLSYVVLRLANIYGPRQNPHGEAGVVAIFAQKLLEDEQAVIFGSGEQTRDFVYVADVVSAVMAASAERISGIFNIGTGVETSVNQLYGMMCGALGSKPEAQYAPARSGEQLRSCISSAAAKAKFGWAPGHSIMDGIRLTCEWFRKEQG